MLHVLDSLRDMSTLSIFTRLIFSMICGGLIGIERTYHRKPAGFRTHMLICIAASITTMTSQYLFLVLRLPTDPTRIGAQVIAGMGFIGAGTIIVTKKQNVKGLTTAAGLWATAIIGLANGTAFYEGGLIATILVLLAELVFSRIEYRMINKSPELRVFVEYTTKSVLNSIFDLIQHEKITLQTVEITRQKPSAKKPASAIIVMRMNHSDSASTFLEAIGMMEGVIQVEEL